jgi:hemerythrin-like domain-containing protein
MNGRRQVIGGAVALGVLGAARALGAEQGKPAELDVEPGEDLMREHGVLRRVMLIYDEAIHRLAGTEAVPLDAVGAGAGIIRRVIEDYHEKLEENFLFPRFEKAKKLAGLVATLRTQHQAGCVVTERVTRLCKAPLKDAASRRQLSDALAAFNRMYRPHAAREDTILFPAFHELVGEKAYRELGEQFEDQEHQALGGEGFEKAVAEVATLEEKMGIADLAKFTPQT